MAAIACLIISLNLNFSTINEDEMFSKHYFVDIFYFAYIQKYALILDGLSLWLIGCYTLKFTQLTDNVSSFFVSLKKSLLEIFFLLIAFFALLVALTFMFVYIYGPSIEDYKSIYSSLFSNLRIFLFIEYAKATTKFLEVNRVISLVLLFNINLGLKIVLFNQINPIFIEYFRNENDQYFLTKKEGKFFEVPVLSKIKFLFNPNKEETPEDSVFRPPPEDPGDGT